jgi:hypothetical protein
MSEELIDRLRAIDRFQNLRRPELLRIAAVTARLRQVSLFDSLSDEELALIAAQGRLERHERGSVLIHEGDLSDTFYVILKGQVRVWTRDEEHRPRLLNYHGAGDFFGERAVLEDVPRGANVDVVEDVELVAFEREGFRLILEHDQIAGYLRSWGRERIRISNQPFEGKEWDEVTIAKVHKSWFVLLQVTAIPITISVLTLVGWALVAHLALLSAQCMSSAVIAVLITMGLWIFWMWEDWRNDDFIITSKRVISIDRILIPPFPVERREVFLEHIQDVINRNHGLWTWLFDVYTLEAQTAGVGIVRFAYLDHADELREEIFRARRMVLARKMGEDRGRIRQKLLAELDRPVQTITPLEREEEEPELTPKRAGCLLLLDYFIPHTKIVKRDQIIWRRHWVILLQAVAVPALLFVFAVALLVVVVALPGPLGEVPLLYRALLPGLLAVFAFGWYQWRYSGWRNDIYIVTDTRLIDIAGSPFHVRGESRIESTFDVIQNTDYSSPNLIARILRIGNVTIDTASQRNALTFDSVPRPEDVQQEIFKRLTAFRERREREESERQYAEFAKWFEAYHHSVIEQEEQSDGF